MRRIAVQKLRKIYRGRSTTLELKVPRLERSSQESGESDVGEKVVRSDHRTQLSTTLPNPNTRRWWWKSRTRSSRRTSHVLAESYIIDSSHAICAVVGFKIPYPPPGGKGSQKLKASGRPDRERQLLAVAARDLSTYGWSRLTMPPGKRLGCARKP